MDIFDIDDLPTITQNNTNIEDVTHLQTTHQGFKEFKGVNIDWTINNECQLDCKYCCTKRDMLVTKPNTDYKKVIKKLKLVLVPFTICVLGGEPTLHPDIIAILDELVSLKHCLGVNLITNLHKPIEFWKELTSNNFSKSSKFSIDASLHPEYYNDKFLDKVNFIKSTSTEINVLLNVFPEEKYYDKMKHAMNNMDVTIVNIFETEDYKPQITDEFLDMFFADENNMYKFHINNVDNFYNHTQLEKFNLTNFKGWKCTAQDLVITQEGELLNACTRQKIQMYTPKIRDELIVCPLNKCSCDTFMHFYKTKGK
jgi:MoaA/NifB/PqqE/SkfB family radical SAM enzyme